MRALWKGAVTFGLVKVPISFPATRREELKFQFLRSSEQCPVNYKRVAEADGKEAAKKKAAVTGRKPAKRKKAA
jgi:DNA end-binding protein Ku